VQLALKLHSAACLRPIALAASLAAVAFGLAAGPTFAQEASAEAGQTKSITCAACHGADGNSVAMETPAWPSLASQHSSYIVRQLEAFKSGERTDPGMQGIVSTLSEQDMHDVAAWFGLAWILVAGGLTVRWFVLERHRGSG
jgi:cytochrome c553